MATEGTEVAALCSKCGKNPRAANGSTNPWCNDCKSKYQQEYKRMITERNASKAFIAGVEAMRKTLVLEFSRHAKVVFSGAEIAFAINNTPRPQMQLESDT